jgi:hypothetical protein
LRPFFARDFLVFFAIFFLAVFLAGFLADFFLATFAATFFTTLFFDTVLQHTMIGLLACLYCQLQTPSWDYRSTNDRYTSLTNFHYTIVVDISKNYSTKLQNIFQRRTSLLLTADDLTASKWWCGSAVTETIL